MDINSYSRNSFEYTLLRAIAEGQVVGQLRKACEQWVATQDRFNLWFLRVPKRHYSEDQLLSVIDIAANTHEEAVIAWKVYQTLPSSEAEGVLIQAFSRSCEAVALLIEEPTLVNEEMPRPAMTPKP